MEESEFTVKSFGGSDGCSGVFWVLRTADVLGIFGSVTGGARCLSRTVHLTLFRRVILHTSISRSFVLCWLMVRQD